MLSYTAFCTGLFGCTCMHGVIQREACGVFVLYAVNKAAFVLVPTSIVLRGEMCNGGTEHLPWLGSACGILSRASFCEAMSCDITDDGSTGLSINFSSSKHSHLYFPHYWSLTFALCYAWGIRYFLLLILLKGLCNSAVNWGIWVKACLAIHAHKMSVCAWCIPGIHRHHTHKRNCLTERACSCISLFRILELVLSI